MPMKLQSSLQYQSKSLAATQTMMPLLLLLAVAIIRSSTLLPRIVQAELVDCIVSLQEIFDDQVAALDLPQSSGPREYILCPNADYQAPQGRALIEVFTSNIVISCGSDGSSWNNCVLRGVGQRGGASGNTNGYQVIVASRSDNVKIENVEFRGISFSDMEILGDEDVLGDVSILIESQSAVKFVDCHWRNNVGETIFTSSVKPLESNSSRRRQLSGHGRRRDTVEDKEKQIHRHLSETNFRSNVQVEFHQCSFMVRTL